MPVLAIAREGLRRQRGVVMRNAATNVQELVVPNAGPLADGGSARHDDRRGAELSQRTDPAAARRVSREGPRPDREQRHPDQVGEGVCGILRITWPRCALTVISVIPSSPPTCLFIRPDTTRAMT